MPVGSFWCEAILILALILLNGFFAGAEIAVVSARRSVLETLATKKKGAAIVREWLKAPETFLATVQIGITLVGALASAVAGATAIEFIKPKLQRIDFLAPWANGPWADSLAIGIVVVVITYLSLILGELVPKSLGLTYRERMATAVALPIYWLSRVVKPFVAILTWSTRWVLRLFGQKEIPKELFATEDEIRFLLKEGGSQGIFDSTEQQMIPKIFDFSETPVKNVMVSRDKIVALDINVPREKLLPKMAEEGFTRLPIYEGSLETILGILHMKDLIHIIILGQGIILQDLIRSTFFVPETLPAKELLVLFQKKHLHMAIVQSSDGKTVGIITLEDLIERIVGDIKDEHDIA
jgi:putative hemolysin